MLLELSRIPKEGDRVERRYEPSAFHQGDDDYSVSAPVDLWFDISKDKDRYRLEGTVRTTLELTCGRCLEPFSRPVEASFDLRYLPHTVNSGTGEVEIEEDDLSTAYYRDEVIDLGQLMREQFYLTLPMKPLCREDCQGLCPECGTNLNREACACAPRWEDPRLAPLKGLLDDRSKH